MRPAPPAATAVPAASRIDQDSHGLEKNVSPPLCPLATSPMNTAKNTRAIASPPDRQPAHPGMRHHISRPISCSQHIDGADLNVPICGA